MTRPSATTACFELSTDQYMDLVTPEMLEGLSVQLGRTVTRDEVRLMFDMEG